MRPSHRRIQDPTRADNLSSSPSSSPLRLFLSWPAGASLLYLVSAACLLGGAALVLAPGSGDEGRILERITMLATVEVYVAAIAALAALVCYWKPGNGDAVALLVLMALFVPGMNAGLSTIATHQPLTALALGISGLALAAGYAALVQQRVTGWWGWKIAGPLVVMQTWHAISPGMLGLAYGSNTVPESLISAWLPGWWMVIASGWTLAGFALYAKPSERIAAPTELIPEHVQIAEPILTTEQAPDDDLFVKAHLRLPNDQMLTVTPPTVATNGLRWMLATVAVVAGGLHQWLLTYSLNLGLTGWDLFALIVITLVLIDVLLRQWKLNAPGLLPILETIAGVIAIFIARSGSYVADPTAFGGIICYPPLVLVLGGVALLIIAWRDRDRGSLVAATCWCMGALLTWGITADHLEMNTKLAGAAGFVLLCFVIAFAPHRRWLWLALLVILFVGTTHPEWGAALITAAAVISRGIRTRSIATGATSLAPLLAHSGGWIPGALSFIAAAGGWLAIIAAFVLLGGGAWVSWRRARTPAPGFPQTPFI